MSIPREVMELGVYQILRMIRARPKLPRREVVDTLHPNPLPTVHDLLLGKLDKLFSASPHSMCRSNDNNSSRLCHSLLT